MDGTSIKIEHDCWHLPIYFLVRAIFPDGNKTNWAITYYCRYHKCVSRNLWDPVGTEETSWGAIKNLHL